MAAWEKVNQPLKFADVYPPTVLFSFCKPCVPSCSPLGICLLWQKAAPDLTKGCWIIRSDGNESIFVPSLSFPHEIVQKAALWTEARTASVGAQFVAFFGPGTGKNAIDRNRWKDNKVEA